MFSYLSFQDEGIQKSALNRVAKQNTGLVRRHPGPPTGGEVPRLFLCHGMWARPRLWLQPRYGGLARAAKHKDLADQDAVDKYGTAAVGRLAAIFTTMIIQINGGRHYGKQGIEDGY